MLTALRHPFQPRLKSLPIEAVAQLDWTATLEEWYEIARIPNWFRARLALAYRRIRLPKTARLQ